MSRPSWWNYVQSCIRDYPVKCAEQDGIREWLTKPDGEARALAQNPRRPTEIMALRRIAKRGLMGQRGQEYHAVRLAIQDTMDMPDGRERIAFIGLLYSDANASLKSAIARSGVSSETAQLWRGEFVRRIAFYLGLLRERRIMERPGGIP
ncbi:MAG: hypothetical protein IJQ81_11080 [Oscillibacter sp.]|nr:hypothetical protein [Oscillibacter sp.]